MERKSSSVAVLVLLALAVACGGSPTRPTSTQSSGTSGGTTVVPPQPTPPVTPVPVPTLSVSRILCFGDSLTEGYIAVTARWLRAARPESYPSQLRGMLVQRYTSQPFTVDNAGLSGEWALDGQYRIVQTVKASSPEVVVIMEGANDLGGLGEAGIVPALEAVEDMLRDARALGAKVVLASLPPQRPGSVEGRGSALIDEFNDGIERLAARQRVLFADVHAAFGADLSAIGPDGLHPTAEGYVRIAQVVFDVLRTNFEQPARSTGAATGRSLPAATQEDATSSRARASASPSVVTRPSS